LGFVYILSNAEGILLALKEKAPKAEPRISSLSCLYPAVLLHERELVDLFGAQIEGLPEGLSYPLPDGWPEGNYPMRKEWNPKYFDKDTMTYNPPAESTGKEVPSK
jgi:Ni,Fe-hydrogenase III component G